MDNTIIRNQITSIYNSSRTFLSYSFLGIFSQVLSAIPPFVIAVQISTSEYASYSLTKMIILFFIAFFFTSSQTPFIINAQREYAKTQKISKTMFIQFSIFLIGLFAVISIQLFFHKSFQRFADISLNTNIFATIALLAVVLTNLISSIFLATGRKKISISVELVYNFLLNLFVILGYFLREISVEDIFKYYIVSGFITVLIFLPLIDLKKIFPLSTIQNKSILKNYLIFTSWQIFGFLGIYLSNWGDNLVLRKSVPIEQIGIYNFAYGIYLAARSIGNLIVSYFTPDITKNCDNQTYIENYLGKKRTIITLIYCLCCVAVLLLLPIVLNLIYGNKFTEALPILYMLIPASVLSFYTIFYIPILNTRNKYKFVQINNVLVVLINLILDLILIKSLGILGAAIATSISLVYLGASLTIYYKRISN